VAPTRYRYGGRRAQVAELWRPVGERGDLPVVVLLHGGFWRSMYTKMLMRGLAAAVVERGWAAWNVEYRRLGPLGGGGGWPATFADVAAAVDHLAVVDGVDLARVATCGHSAGGQLALWAAARGRLPAEAPGASPRVAVKVAVSLAGVVDLHRAAALGLGGGAVELLLGGRPEDVADRYAVASPAARLPHGVPQVLVHGSTDTVVPPSMSEGYQRDAVRLGDDAVYVPLDGVGHREVIARDGRAWQETARHLERLLS
jgi:acetyl esterase/lipase